MDIKIYTPRREQSISKLFKEIFIGFKEGRELAWRLFVRDMQAGYRKSMLGFVWLFLPPIATASIWIFLNGQRVVAIQETPMKYAGFTLCGTLLWSLFAEAIIKPMARYQAAMSMMGKLNFPREAIILASVYDLAFGFLLRLIILIPGLWMMGYSPTWYFLPAFGAIVGLVLGGLSIGLFLTPVGLLYTDIGKGLPIVLPFAMYLTPVIYPMRQQGMLSFLQVLNPVTPFLERARSLMGDYSFTMNHELVGWSCMIIMLLLIGLITIKIALPIIVERSGS